MKKKVKSKKIETKATIAVKNLKGIVAEKVVPSRRTADWATIAVKNLKGIVAEKVVPKYLSLSKSTSEKSVDNIFIYASVAVITVALTLLFISLFAL